jgi:hypothetical protein
MTRNTLSAVILGVLLASALLFLGACAPEEESQSENTSAEQEPAEQEAEDTTDSSEEPAEQTPSALAWTDIELTDVETGETFTISEFTDGPVLVQAFAVW